MVNFERNMELVKSVYYKDFKKFGWLKDDLIQGGYIGLLNACKRFDETKGFTFSTFAVKCIRNEMLMIIRKENRFYKNTMSLDTTINKELGLTMLDELYDKCYCEDIGLSYDCLLEFIRTLEEPKVFVMKLKGFKNIEIADQLEMTPSKVSNLLKKQKELFKNRFSSI